jgi:hypothetical protein
LVDEIDATMTEKNGKNASKVILFIIAFLKSFYIEILSNLLHDTIKQ